jgi:hypothetical protein
MRKILMAQQKTVRAGVVVVAAVVMSGEINLYLTRLSSELSFWPAHLGGILRSLPKRAKSIQ